MAKGATLERACRELVALPPDAWERCLIEILVRWRTEIPVDPAQRTVDEDNFMTTTNTAFDELKTSLRNEGLSQGLAPLVRLFRRKLGRALTEAESATVRERLVTHGADRLGDVVLDLDGPALERWLTDPTAR